MTSMTSLEVAVNNLLENYHQEEVLAAAEKILGASVKPLPIHPSLRTIIGPEELDRVVRQTDASIVEIEEALEARDAAYKNKADLVKRQKELDTEIKLAESEAIMAIRGEGKEAHVMIGDEKTYLTNDKARDAYRRMASKTQREELAKVEGELACIEVDLFRARDTQDAKKAVLDAVQAKASVQANLLKYMSTRG